MNDQAQMLLDRFDETVDGVALLETTDQVRILDVMIGRLQSRQADTVRELDSGDGLDGSGCKTVGSWTRLHLRRGVSAYRITQRAKLLPQLPGFADAFERGEVTDEHVDTVIRWVKPCGLEAIQAHEPVLVQLAKAASAKELGQALEAIADLARPDRDADWVAALAGRFIKLTALGELVHLDAMIEPALAEALKTAVEAGAKLPKGVKPADDPRTLDQRRADAFGEIIYRGIDPDAGRTGRLRPQVALTVDLEFLAGIDGAPPALLDHFGIVPAATVHRLICDANLTRVVLDTATGLPLSVGRSSRLAVKRQRRALNAIFRHCAFPGCEVPFRFCEIHHLAWWCRDNGGTDLELLVPYCWTHHHFVHEYGFTAAREHGQLIHRRPDGTTIPDPDHALRDTVEQLKLDHHRSDGWPKDGDPRPPPGS